jgi:hypothetical protein
MIRTWIPGTLMLLIALVLAGCGGQTAAPATSEPAQPTAAPTATEQMVKPTATVAPTIGPEPAAVGGDLTLDSRDVGLDQLKSYRVTWKADWETMKNGKAEQANWDWLLESTTNPVGSLTVWKGADASGLAPGSWEHWEDGSNAGYVSIDADGKKTCSSLWNARYFSPAKRNVSSIPGLFFLPRMLGSLSGAKYAGTETVNGIRSNRYTYDEKAANRADLGKVAGEIWVAADAGYVVKDMVSWEGGAGPFEASTADGESGKGSWTWELTDPNGAVTIPPLATCDSATDGPPVISGGYQKTVTGDVMVYQAYHGEKVVPFYQKEMVTGGWKQSGEPTSKDGVMSLAFTKDGQKTLVSVTPKGQISDVKIEVTKEQ